MGALCAVIAILSVVVPFAAGLALLGTAGIGLGFPGDGADGGSLV